MEHRGEFFEGSVASAFAYAIDGTLHLPRASIDHSQ
jgi:hypothetical protein